MDITETVAKVLAANWKVVDWEPLERKEKDGAELEPVPEATDENEFIESDGVVPNVNGDAVELVKPELVVGSVESPSFTPKEKTGAACELKSNKVNNLRFGTRNKYAKYIIFPELNNSTIDRI